MYNTLRTRAGWLGVLAAAALTACQNTSVNVPVGGQAPVSNTNIIGTLPGLGGATTPQAPLAPQIASLDYLPKTAISASDAVAFTLVATDPAGRPLQYNWTASKGQLLSTAGSTVTWRPLKPDGSVDVGTAVVSVVVSNGVASTTGSVQIGVATGEAPASGGGTPAGGQAPAAGGTTSATAKTQTVIISRLTPGVALAPAAAAAPSAAPSATP